VTACLRIPAQPATTAIAAPSRRLVLILDQHRDRLDRTARAIAAAVPGARVLMASAARDITQTAGPLPDVGLVRIGPDGWAAASVLTAYRPPLPGRTVDAFLVTEGPLERFTVLITDFPGLRLVPPRAGLAAFMAGLVRDAVSHNA
jgi:hypothetical protein